MYKLEVQLNLDESMNYFYMGSVLHGFLLSNVSEDMAEWLHNQTQYSPLKQRVYQKENRVTWEIVILNEALFKEVSSILNNKGKIYLSHYKKNISYTIINSQKIEISQCIKDIFSQNEVSRYIKLNFITPTSSKTKGQYDIFPDIKKIYRSIMLNISTFYPEHDLYDTETLDYLVSNTRIVEYKLRTTKFYLEGTKIPSFQGNIVLQISGPLTARQLSHLLLNLGQWSGVGIKTSLGMGKYELN